MIKIHKTTLKALVNFSTTEAIAKKANDLLEKGLNHLKILLTLAVVGGKSAGGVELSRITDDEESKSQNSVIPSEILRSAMKISFIYAAKYRHVILLTKDKKLQSLSEMQQVFCSLDPD